MLLLAATFPFSVFTKTEETSEVYQQNSVTVTASRYEQSEDDVIPSISVIDRQDILNLQANNILDILSLQQGIDVARNGGNGTATSIFMRGTNSNHSLVLIDGMRVGSSFTGSFSWEHLPVSQIERIEIVRGTRVSYYGADAIGGVINIITRKQDNLNARYTTGSFGTQNFDASFGKSDEKSQFGLSVGSQKTDGFSATNENNFFGFDPDDDGYENQSVNLSYSRIMQKGNLKMNFLDVWGDTDFDPGNSDIRERVARASWQQSIFSGWNSEVSIGNNYNKIATKIYSSTFNSNRYTLDWLLNKQIDYGHLSYGLTYRNETAEFNNPNAVEVSFSDARTNLAVFTNWRGVFAKNIFSGSLRFDDNSAYGSDTSADLDWAYNLSKTSRFNLSIGSAFKAPSINELFSPNFQGLTISPVTGETVFAFAFEGNPDLKPEEALNYEIGFKTKFSDNHKFGFNLFYYKIDNLIDFQGPTFKPINVNQATIKGLETNYNFQRNNLVININATIQDANNDETNTPLLRRPENKLNVSVDKFFNQFSLGSSLRYASKNPDFGIEVDGYTVIDLRAAYEINSHWKVSAKIENVTDQDYQIINGYNTPDLSGYLTIQWQQ